MTTAMRQLRARDAKRDAGRRTDAGQRQQHQRRRADQREAHADLHLPPRQAGDDAGAEPRAEHRGADDGDQRHELDFDDGDVDQRLDQRRQRVADVQRAGDLLVAHDLPSSGTSTSWSRTSRCRACRRSW